MTGNGKRELGVSVIIPTYNREGLVVRAIRSALVECQPGDEVIVVDDGSTDNTEAAIAPLRDRIVYLRIANGGPGRARNLGMQRAQNDLIAFLDSDDEWQPGKLELQRELFRHHGEVVLCTSDLTLRFASGEEWHYGITKKYYTPGFLASRMGECMPYSRIAPLPSGREDFEVHIGDLYRVQMAHVCVAADTVMIHRGRAGDALRFPEDIFYHEDLECFSRVARTGPAAFLNCEGATMYFNFAPQLTDMSYTSTLDSRLKVIERVWGQDKKFLAQHHQEYEQTLRRLRMTRVWQLLNDGATTEARRELRRANGVPFSYQLLSWLPGVFASRLLWRWCPNPPTSREAV